MFSRVEYFVDWKIFQEPLTWAFHKFLDKLIFKSLTLVYGNLAAVLNPHMALTLILGNFSCSGSL